MLLPGLALPRSARLPVLAALREDLNCPILLLTDRADRALTLLDELSFWAPEVAAPVLPRAKPACFTNRLPGARSPAATGCRR